MCYTLSKYYIILGDLSMGLLDNIEVVARDKVFMDGKPVKLTRLGFDNYHTHCRDVFSLLDLFVIKFDGTERNYTTRQTKRELSLWKKFLKKEERFFCEPIYNGYIYEDKKYNWMIQKYVVADYSQELEDHPDFNEFDSILNKYGLHDVYDKPENAWVTIDGIIKCWDYAV